MDKGITIKMFHPENNGLVMENSRRKDYNRKLQLQDGRKVALLTATEASDLAKASLSHAYRIAKDPDKYLTPTVKELLIIKAIDQIPGWETG